MEEWFKNWFDADYAALYSHRDEEEASRAVATALDVAPGLASGPVLDLGCGAGRHLAVLRAKNPLAFGLDLSAHLLGLAPHRLRGWLLRGDMRHLPLRPGSLSGICLWFTPFGYFRDDENRQLITNLHHLLAPGGILLVDFLNAHDLELGLAKDDTIEREGLRVRNRRSMEGKRIVKRMTIERLDSGATREVVESVRVYYPEELQEMAEKCGLILDLELGDYDGASFKDKDSPRWIGLFHKKVNG